MELVLQNVAFAELDCILFVNADWQYLPSLCHPHPALVVQPILFHSPWYHLTTSPEDPCALVRPLNIFFTVTGILSKHLHV